MENEFVRELAAAYPKLVVIYTCSLCENCVNLVPKLVNIMNEKEHGDYHTLEVDASEKQVVLQTVMEKQAPLVIITHNGLVLNTQTINSEEEFRELLKGN